jgi:hypothetical protein
MLRIYVTTTWFELVTPLPFALLSIAYCVKVDVVLQRLLGSIGRSFVHRLSGDVLVRWLLI